MQALRKYVSLAEPQVAHVAMAGFALAAIGLTVQDTFGATTMAAGLGLALALAGSTYVATGASTKVRLGTALTALVAAPLLFFGGPLQLLGGVSVAALALGIAYTRIA